MTEITTRRANLNDSSDTAFYKALLNAYAADPMGRGKPLTTDVLDRVVADLSNHPTARVWLGDYQNVSVGFATAFLGYSTFNAAPLLNIHDVAVLPKYRNLGVASALLDAMANTARSEGCCKLTLEFRADNDAARRLYDSKGFRAAELPSGENIQYHFLEFLL